MKIYGTLHWYFLVPILHGSKEEDCNNVLEINVDEHWYYLHSPNYPGNYEINENKCWLLIASNANQVVFLHVIDSQISTDSAYCGEDYMTVYDGSNANMNVLRHFCGDDEPQIISSGRSMLVRFVTDSSGYNLRGFNARFRSVNQGVPINSLVPPEPMPSWGVDSGCVRTEYYLVNHTEHELRSPGYPQSYNNDMDLCWQLNIDTPYSDDVVRVIIEDSELQPNQFCQLADFVAIYDGPSIWDTELTSFCGNDYPTEITGSKDFMLVHFHTNSNLNNYKGIRLIYYLTDDSKSEQDFMPMTAKLLLGISIAFLALFLVIAFIIYHKKAGHQQRAVSATPSTRSNATGVSFLSSSSSISPSRNVLNTTNTEREESFDPDASFTTQNFLASSLTSARFSRNRQLEFSAIQEDSLRGATPVQPPPYSPKEDPPKYTPPQLDKPSHVSRSAKPYAT